MQSDQIYIESLGINDISLRLSAVWSSDNPGYRQTLRQTMWNYLSQHLGRTDLQAEHFLNLETHPQCQGLFLSVSHCPGLGGWSMGRSPVGFDIELVSRVNRAVVARISAPAELAQVDAKLADSWSTLWTAKEAGWKYFNLLLPKGEVPRTVSDLRVDLAVCKSNYVYKNLKMALVVEARYDFTIHFINPKTQQHHTGRGRVFSINNSQSPADGGPDATSVNASYMFSVCGVPASSAL